MFELSYSNFYAYKNVLNYYRMILFPNNITVSLIKNSYDCIIMIFIQIMKQFELSVIHQICMRQIFLVHNGTVYILKSNEPPRWNH